MNRFIFFFARFVLKPFRSIRREGAVGGVALKHSADLLPVVKWCLDADRLRTESHCPSSTALEFACSCMSSATDASQGADGDSLGGAKAMAAETGKAIPAQIKP